MTSTLEKLEDNKGQSEAIKKDRQYSDQRKRTKVHKMINKTLHKSLKIEKHELHLQQMMHPSAS
jgi:hypothetical protein